MNTVYSYGDFELDVFSRNDEQVIYIWCYSYSKRQSSFYFGVCCVGFWLRKQQIPLQNPSASAGGFIVNDKLFLSFTIHIQYQTTLETHLESR